MFEWPLCALACLAAASVLEYALHRWVLHRIGDFHTAHVKEHHESGLMDDRHTRYTWAQAAVLLAVTSPALVAGLSLSWGALLWPCTIVWWKYAHEAVHRATHGEAVWERRASLLCPWWRWCVRHHLTHHLHANRNYGNLFPWADWVFFTQARQGERT